MKNKIKWFEFDHDYDFKNFGWIYNYNLLTLNYYCMLYTHTIEFKVLGLGFNIRWEGKRCEDANKLKGKKKNY